MYALCKGRLTCSALLVTCVPLCCEQTNEVWVDWEATTG